MILANLRERLSADDLRLVLDLLSGDDPGQRAALERRLGQDGPDALLDDPALPALLRAHPGYIEPSAPLFLYVTVRDSLRRTGIDSRPLADYLGALLYEFGFRDRAMRISPHDDASYRYLHDLVTALDDEGSPRRRFLLRAHLGNFSLWLSGFFPDYVTHRRERRGGPDFSYYEALGQRGYRAAADHRLAREVGLADVYLLAAEAFTRLRVALNRLSDQTLFPRTTSVERLLRQVSDDARHPPPGGTLL